MPGMRAAVSATAVQSLPTTNRSTVNRVNLRKHSIAPITLRLIGLKPVASCSITTSAVGLFNKVTGLWPPAVIYPPARQHPLLSRLAGAVWVPLPQAFAGAVAHPH